MRKKILVTPEKALKRDLHLKLLYNLLSKNGFDVYPFNINNIFKYRKNAIWHIHWIDIFYRGTLQKFGIYTPSFFISAIRFLIFTFYLFFVKVLNIKIVWSIHNVSSHEFGDTIFEKNVTKILLHFSDCVTAYNQHIKGNIEKKYDFSNIHVIYQGIYENCYPDPPSKKSARSKLKLPADKFILLFFGSLLPYKGVDIIINGVNKLKDDEILVVIAGSSHKNPEYGQTIKELSKKDKRIFLIDRFISEEEIPILFGAADYTIYPYRRIDNSGVLFMSITFGVPVIISNKGGVKEIIDLAPDVGILIDEPINEKIIDAITIARNKMDISTSMDKLKEKLSWKHLETQLVKVFNL